MKLNALPVGIRRLIAGLIVLLVITSVYITAAMSGAFKGVTDPDELRSVYAAKGED